MSKLTDAFKAFTQALLDTDQAIPGDRLADVVEYAAEHYTAPSDGADGADGAPGAPGAHVTAIELEVDGEGAVTGGTATLSDDTTVPITVTTSSDGG